MDVRWSTLIRELSVGERSVGEHSVGERSVCEPAGELSAGEARQLTVAESLVARPCLPLLDEPTLGRAAPSALGRALCYIPTL